MQRITYECIDDTGQVVHKRVWDVPPEGDVHFLETRPIQHRYRVGSFTPYGREYGPTTLQITAIVDPHVRWEPFNETAPTVSDWACCANEQRNINGGCDNCGSPCL